MKLAVYHPWLKSKGGAEKVLLELLERSSHDITLFTLYIDRDATFDRFADHDVQVVGSGRAPRGFVDRAVRFGLGALTTRLPLDRYDALVVSEAGLGSLITLRNHGLPVHCYCHTPLRAALPDFHGTYRDEVTPLLRPLFDIGTLVYGWLERRAWKRFDTVMANSRLTERRIREKGLWSGDIPVINPGVDLDAFDADAGQDPYFLYPSRFRRYKRQDLAIKAFQQADIDGFDLVLAGSADEEGYIDELEEMAGPGVDIRTDVPDEEWRELYEHAYAVLFLAEEEDWGIAPLEAMA
ncbi:MAG: glycosyltransferase, partial [Candidatus Nanohaloarchaea archaeon]|nr:glycosyltransferase [Candidatus Nanohaloarchaea archaeon]